MTDEEFSRENGYEYGSVRGILLHPLSAETAYISRVCGLPVPESGSSEAVNEANLPSVEALRARWAEQEKITRAFLDGVTDSALDADVSFTRRDGVQVSQPLWQILTLVYQHTLQHRSEAAEALTMVGRSPGGLDFPLYLASKA
jgi:uncharacterized damage-inducible protein DinB